MIRFFMALWLAKIIKLIYDILGQHRTDMPGLLANKVCPDFLERIAKPRLIIAITGTNGKTTTSAIVNDFLNSQGLKTSFNNWGANCKAGYALNFIRGVNIFNRPTVDCAVLEADELTLDSEMTKIIPQYILVTNIAKDTLRRNGHPENIYNHIEHTFNLLGKRTIGILNANDPISSALAKSSKRVYYEMNDCGLKPFDNSSKDIDLCPNCLEKITYKYRHYRQVGKYICPNCGFTTPKSKYLGEQIDLKNKFLFVNGFTYKLISDSIFHAFDQLCATALFLELGYKEEKIAEFFTRQRVTEIRETYKEYNNIKYYAYVAKSESGSAGSTVFEYVANEPSDKDVILFMNIDIKDKHAPLETISWIYETDYEFLNTPKIKKIIVPGSMRMHVMLRLLLAGIPREKIILTENEEEVPKYVDTEYIQSVYILNDTTNVTRGKHLLDSIINYAKEKNK